MTTSPGSLASLLAALEKPGERPPAAGAWVTIATRFLAPDETVLLALEGNGFTWWDPLLLVTDRRVLHLRRGAVLPYRLIREFPAHEVAGAEFRRRFLWGPVVVRTRGGARTWIRSDGDDLAQRFVDGVNALIAGRR